jgi:hypothetical protein
LTEAAIIDGSRKVWSPNYVDSKCTRSS